MPLFRTQSAAEQTSLAPHDSKARLQDVTKRRDSWRSHVHRTYIAQRVQLFKIETANVRGRGGRPLVLSLGGLKGGYSLSEKENIPLCPLPLPRPHTLWGQKQRCRAAPSLRPTGAKRNSPRGLLSSRARGAKVVQIVNMGYLSPFLLFFLWIICCIDFWRFRG